MIDIENGGFTVKEELTEKLTRVAQIPEKDWCVHGVYRDICAKTFRPIIVDCVEKNVWYMCPVN